jgi:deferrochelatase/peroxidase EfeB
VDLAQSHEFYTGDRQAGIETPQQRHCVFMAFDLTTTSSRDLQVLLARWSAAISQLMAGRPVGSVQPPRVDGVAGDTGEALDLGPASLTVTLGLGPGVFDDRFGLRHRAPKRLAPLPRLPSDQLRTGLTGGDLCLQACADDPQVAYHAVRDLARMGRGVVNTRWTVLGFGRASAGRGQRTPRNLLGFKDGTRNLKQPTDIDEFVWLDQDDDVDWMRNGTYQVVRKIEMNIETWDADVVSDQERVIGRAKQDGAPLTGKTEFDKPDFTATGPHAIDPRSHIALAAFENNGGIRILRRGYNYTDGINDLGHLDAGLLFVCFTKDPAHFVRLQTKLGSSDLLNEYIAHIGSGIFAVPPAPSSGGYIGQELFG